MSKAANQSPELRAARTARVLRRAKLDNPTIVPPLENTVSIDYASSHPADVKTARALLAQHRKDQPSYRAPETQKRHLFRSKSTRKAATDESYWRFENHEVACAFDKALTQEPLITVGTAHAILVHRLPISCSLEELWNQKHGSSSARKPKNKLGDFQTDSPPIMTWLDRAAHLDDARFVHMMCQIGVNQPVLDRAFGIALRQHSINVMEVLLTWNANASPYLDDLRDQFWSNGSKLVELLLSAPRRCMSTTAWQHSLSVVAANKQQSHLLLSCLNYRPDIACESLLFNAVEAGSLDNVFAILAHADPQTWTIDISHKVCRLVSGVIDPAYRFDLLELLYESGLLLDNEATRTELFLSVASRHVQILQLLVSAQIAIDVPPNDSIAYAIAKMDLQIVELLKDGIITRKADLALDVIPAGTEEAEILRLLRLLPIRDTCNRPMNIVLNRAVSERFCLVVRELLSLGASVEYEGARAIRTAIEMRDASMFDVLITYPCCKKVLSTILPTVLMISSSSFRCQVMKAVLDKGIEAREFGPLLQTIIHEPSRIDFDLVKIVVHHGASLETTGNDTMNAVLHTASRCDSRVMKLLCGSQVPREILAQAVEIAFKARHEVEYQAALDTLTVLLERGATGPLVDQILLAAIKEDGNLAMVRTLVKPKPGADANFDNGTAFGLAIESHQYDLLKVICRDCPPNQAAVESNLEKLIDPRYYSSMSLELFLRSSTFTATALNSSWASAKLSGHQHLRTIIPCFIGHGLSVDSEDGGILSFALDEADIEVLHLVLQHEPCPLTLRAAFKKAAVIKPRRFQIEAIAALLKAAKFEEIGQSAALLQQTIVAIEGDIDGLLLLVNHGFNVDHERGAALSAAAAAGHVVALKILLSGIPSRDTIHQACLATAGSLTLTDAVQERILGILLAARSRETMELQHMSILLTESVSSFPNHTQLPVLLLERHVPIEHETFATAIRTSSQQLFKTLVIAQSPSIISKIFATARKTHIDSGRRCWIYEVLLRIGVDPEGISEAFVASVLEENDNKYGIPELLLEYGATVDFESHAAFKYALERNCLHTLELLSHAALDDDRAGVAFDLALDTDSLEPDIRLKAYGWLLHWSIAPQSIYQALVGVLQEDQPDERTVSLLLSKGADPNEEHARCFILAAADGAESIFRRLSRIADVTKVLQAFIKHFSTEWEIVLWFDICLQELRSADVTDHSELLYDCMKAYPNGTALLKILLHWGVSPATLIEATLAEDWPAEYCTPLVWALFSEQHVSNENILALIDIGGARVLPCYTTAISGTSAALACLLQPSRQSILEALLVLDRDGIMQCQTPAATFRCLGSKGKHDDSVENDLPAELSLRTASLFLGNIEAYKSLGIIESPDDGNLHTAALLALPKFVKWFLNFHDPDAKVPDEFDQMVPLALACRAQSNAWCKVANERADHVTRQEECILLLGPRTNTSWRYRQRTFLHEALDNGPLVTKAMLDALSVEQDPQRDEKYLYQDRDGIYYSPDEYVERLMNGLNVTVKKTLISLLQINNMQSRYFRKVIPGEGVQPDGYRGLPMEYARAWDDGWAG